MRKAGIIMNTELMNILEDYYDIKILYGYQLSLKSTSIENMTGALQEIKNRIKDIDMIIYTDASDEMSERDLALLSNERYRLNRYYNYIYDERIKRKRNTMSVNNKALNHGGIYCDGCMKIPKAGTGFRGYTGISL